MKKESEEGASKTTETAGAPVDTPKIEITVDEPKESGNQSTFDSELQKEFKTEVCDSGISDTSPDEFEYEFDINRYFNTKIQLNMGRPAEPEEVAPDDEVRITALLFTGV